MQSTYRFSWPNETLYKFQFGFRNKHSTNIAITVLIDTLAQNRQADSVVIGVELDYRKAFDTVNCNILLRKLYKRGTRGTCYDWFHSYISNRKQYVCYANSTSKLLDVVCGVPQGSMLGPILFLLYINNISNVTSLLPIIFADDTNVFSAGKQLSEVISTVNFKF